MKIQDINIRDPYVFVEDGVAYMVGTTHHSAWGGTVCGFCGYKSHDLENFEGPFVLFEANDAFWGDKDFWAPELHKYNGKYYLFASFKSNDKCRASHVLVCDEPFGKYVPLKSQITPKDWECLDATMYAEDGVAYTIFCHEWLQCADGQMVLAELDENLDGIKGTLEVIFNASSAPWTSKFEGDNYVTDGPFFYKEKGSTFMIWSSFFNNRYVVLKAECDCLRGKWTHFGSQLDFDGGHAMLFETLSGDRMISLHSPNTTPSERAFFAKF